MNTETPVVGFPESRDTPLPTRPGILPRITFFVMVIVSMAAAAVVSEAPLMLVGLY